MGDDDICERPQLRRSWLVGHQETLERQSQLGWAGVQCAESLQQLGFIYRTHARGDNEVFGRGLKSKWSPKKIAMSTADLAFSTYLFVQPILDEAEMRVLRGAELQQLREDASKRSLLFK